MFVRHYPAEIMSQPYVSQKIFLCNYRCMNGWKERDGETNFRGTVDGLAGVGLCMDE